MFQIPCIPHDLSREGKVDKQVRNDCPGNILSPAQYIANESGLYHEVDVLSTILPTNPHDLRRIQSTAEKQQGCINTTAYLFKTANTLR